MPEYENATPERNVLNERFGFQKDWDGLNNHCEKCNFAEAIEFVEGLSNKYSGLALLRPGDYEGLPQTMQQTSRQVFKKAKTITDAVEALYQATVAANNSQTNERFIDRAEQALDEVERAYLNEEDSMLQLQGSAILLTTLAEKSRQHYQDNNMPQNTYDPVSERGGLGQIASNLERRLRGIRRASQLKAGFCEEMRVKAENIFEMYSQIHEQEYGFAPASRIPKNERFVYPKGNKEGLAAVATEGARKDGTDTAYDPIGDMWDYAGKTPKREAALPAGEEFAPEPEETA